jgi:hypothetical protein
MMGVSTCMAWPRSTNRCRDVVAPVIVKGASLRRAAFYQRHNGLLVCAIVFLTTVVAWAEDFPDPTKTPGKVDPRLTKEILCAKDFTTTSVRDVSEELKDKVFASYGMQPSNDPCPCEVDHFVPLELGGSNDEENLWPQSYLTKPWNALVKDKLEDRLHSEVCKGETGLKNAQEEIRADWKKAYQKRFGNP